MNHAVHSEADLREALKSVERDENGIVVLSPYGFRIKEIDGKRYVVSQTEEEYREMLGEKPLPSIGNCYTANAYCIRHTCTQRCDLVYNHGWVCICTY